MSGFVLMDMSTAAGWYLLATCFLLESAVYEISVPYSDAYFWENYAQLILYPTTVASLMMYRRHERRMETFLAKFHKDAYMQLGNSL